MYGTGNIPSVKESFIDVLRHASDNGILVVAATQCFTGSVLMGHYAVGRALEDAGKAQKKKVDTAFGGLSVVSLKSFSVKLVFDLSCIHMFSCSSLLSSIMKNVRIMLSCATCAGVVSSADMTVEAIAAKIGYLFGYVTQLAS